MNRGGSNANYPPGYGTLGHQTVHPQWKLMQTRNNQKRMLGGSGVPIVYGGLKKSLKSPTANLVNSMLNDEILQSYLNQDHTMLLN